MDGIEKIIEAELTIDILIIRYNAGPSLRQKKSNHDSQTEFIHLSVYCHTQTTFPRTTFFLK